MKKLVKKALAIVLFVTIIASSSISTMAAPAKKTTSETLQLDGIEKYFSRNVDGTMSFDSIKSYSEGYSQSTINFVQKNVELINEMVISQGATIADDYSVTLYTDTQSSNMKGARASARAKGQSKVVVWATGMVLVYMTSTEANDLYNALGKVGIGCTLAGIIPFLAAAHAIISQACSASLYVASVAIVRYQAQIAQVKKSGKGIIMYVAPMPDGNGSSVSFGSQ